MKPEELKAKKGAVARILSLADMAQSNKFKKKAHEKVKASCKGCAAGDCMEHGEQE